MATDRNEIINALFPGLAESDTQALLDATDPNRETDLSVPGGRLKAAREAKSLSLRGLAELLEDETHYTTIAKLETGKMKMTVEWARKLAPVLQVQQLYLLGDIDALDAPRMVPTYHGDSIQWENGGVKYEGNIGQTYVSAGGPRTFAIYVMLNLDLAPAPGIVAIDPDLTAVRTRKIYLLYRPNKEIDLYAFENDPARFVRWFGGSQDTDLLIGQGEFSVMGTVISVTYFP